jgi:predicted permease
MDRIALNLRHAVRALRKNSGFTVASVVVLSLAIGATTVMFSVLNAVVLRPLPYPFPEQLMVLWRADPDQKLNLRPDYSTVETWRRESRSFADIAVLDPVSVTYSHSDGADRISVARVSPNYFSLLGLRPLQGRPFTQEEAEQRLPVALVSHRFWQSRLGGAANVVGSRITLDGRPAELIGVLPPSTLNDMDVWQPHTLFPDWETRRSARNVGSWLVFGRLRPGVTESQARNEMSRLGSRILPMNDYILGPQPRLGVWMLMGAVLCVLLLAVANTSGLSLARSARRAREFAIRTALGASHLQILAQLLAESAILAGVAGALGTGLAVGGIRLMRMFGPLNLARLNDAQLDVSALGWTVSVSLLAGILVGLAPAIAVLRRRLSPHGLRRALVVAEFAFAILLTTSAGLLVRSWQHVVNVDLGFNPERVVVMNILTRAVVNEGQRAQLYEDILKEVQSLPGVESAGMIGDLLITSDAQPLVTIEGGNQSDPERVRLRVDEVSERVFETIRTPLLRGRMFSKADGPNAVPVVLINETMARRLWPGLDPVGRRFEIGKNDSPNWLTVVGVVGDMRRQGIEAVPIAQVFTALAQNPSGNEQLLVRTANDDSLSMIANIQAAVRRVEKRAPLSAGATLEDRLGIELSQRKFQTSLLVGFSIAALLLAAIGIYGLIHYSVASRIREIGIRMAVGAQPGDIFRIIIREGIQLSVSGIVLGLLGALMVGSAGAKLLFGVTATDPLTFTTVSLLLVAVAAAACYFPARRAMRVEPFVALRRE